MIILKSARQSPYAQHGLKSAFGQTQVRSNPPIIRIKCARQSLCARSSLESSSNQTQDIFALEAFLVQTQLCSKLFLIKLKCARQLSNARSALESTYDQTQVRSTTSFSTNHSSSRLNCAQSRLGLDSIAPKVFARQSFLFKCSWRA